MLQTQQWAKIKLLLPDRVDPEVVSLPYERVIWETAPPGVAPSAQFRFVGMEQATMKPVGYDFWRFITFRGPAGWEFDESQNYPMSYNSLRSVLSEHTIELRLVIPDDPAWLKLKQVEPTAR